MANDVVIRFVGEDKVTTVANKVDKSISQVGGTATKTTGGMNGLAKALSGAAGNLGGMGNTITSVAGALEGAGLATGTFGTALTALTGPVGIAVGVIAGLSVALWNVADASARTHDEVENLKRGIITLAGTQKVGQELYSTLIDLAARTPFERKDIIEMAQSLLATSVEAKKVPGYITAIGDAVATVGGGAEKVDTITRAIGRMNASGKITNEQMMILTENGIDGFGLLSKATGQSKEALIEMASKGLLPAKENLDLLIQTMNGTYGNAMAAQMGTATQAASNLSDAWTDMSAAFGGVVEPAVVAVYDAMTYLVQGTTNAGQAYWNFWDTVNRVEIATVTVLWTRAVDGFTAAWQSVAPAVNSVVKSVTDVTDVIGYYIQESVAMENISNIWNAIAGGAESAYNWISAGATTVVDYINNSAGLTYIRDLWNEIWAAAVGAKNAQDSASGGAPKEDPFPGVSPERHAQFQKYLDTIKTLDEQTSIMYLKQQGEFQSYITMLMKARERYLDGIRNQQAAESGLTTILNEQGYATGQLAQGYGNVSDSIVYAGQVTANYGSSLAATTGATKGATSATRSQADATREAAAAQKEYESNLKEYNSLIKDLRGSYMNIADAQRSLEAAQKDLNDAQDPTRIEELNLAIQNQALDMRDLNNSMAEMRARRDEIAKALANMNDEQIKNNALTAAEKKQLENTNKNLDDLRKRREAVRKALREDKLTAEQRVEFLATEAALTAAINDKQGVKADLEQKQNDAIKAAEQERLKLLEEDKKLQEDLERSQLRAKQAIIDMQKAQQALAEAQDPKRLEAYRDAVTKAEINLANLRAEQSANKVSADELAVSLGINSDAYSTLALSAADTATPLDDVALRSGDITTSIGGLEGTSAQVSSLSSNMATLGTESSDAVAGLTTVKGALDAINKIDIKADLGKKLSDIGAGLASIADQNVKLQTDYISGVVSNISSYTNALVTSRITDFQNFVTAYNSAVTTSETNDKGVKNLINALVTLQNGMDNDPNNDRPLPYMDAQRKGLNTIPLKNVNGMGVTPDTKASSIDSRTQNITINLSYTNPPSSKTPLKDVEDYLAAQGGRLRI